MNLLSIFWKKKKPADKLLTERIDISSDEEDKIKKRKEKEKV